MTSVCLDESYAYCHRLMRTAARNFYFGMRLLPGPKRQAMFALYSFMRLLDDIADEADDTNPVHEAPAGNAAADAGQQQRLEQWRMDAHRAIAGDYAAHPLWPAFGDTVRRFAIPASVFDDAIDGQRQDLTQKTYGTFDELYRYCYRVASTVGIAAIHIWGFRESRAVKLAEERGIAMQLTNILRDIREDCARGRRYLPADDCARFGLCDPLPMDPQTAPAAMESLLRFESERADGYYQSSASLDELVAPDARPTLRIMTGIYRGILRRIMRNPRMVLARRVGLSTCEKLALVGRYALRSPLLLLGDRR